MVTFLKTQLQMSVIDVAWLDKILSLGKISQDTYNKVLE